MEGAMFSMHFLLIDDEEVLIETIAERLRLKGFVVDCALSGNEAFYQLEKNDTIDIIVLDIKMPDMDGMNILERLKAKYPLIEVIMLTGHATIESAVKALKCGAFDYLLKPCDLNDLLSKANKAFSRKREREAKILNVKLKPYISDREREEMISRIMKE
ncbi:response regulator [Desulforapulum autotrophicum]|nr:response regulator [Desulforapulum autotrophicum]